jgi:hypothetical protein
MNHATITLATVAMLAAITAALTGTIAISIQQKPQSHKKTTKEIGAKRLLFSNRN